MIAYALPSFVMSVTVATHPRATPTAPANIPCNNLTAIACRRDVQVPKSNTVTALPNKDIVSTNLRPCLSAAVAYSSEAVSSTALM
jgi:hypothetical protein